MSIFVLKYYIYKIHLCSACSSNSPPPLIARVSCYMNIPWHLSIVYLIMYLNDFQFLAVKSWASMKCTYELSSIQVIPKSELLDHRISAFLAIVNILYTIIQCGLPIYFLTRNFCGFTCSISSAILGILFALLVGLEWNHHTMVVCLCHW